MIHNNKVYANADEKFVKNTIIYTDYSTKKLYYDSEKTQPVYHDELFELFLNGVIMYSEFDHAYLNCEKYIPADNVIGDCGTVYKYGSHPRPTEE